MDESYEGEYTSVHMAYSRIDRIDDYSHAGGQMGDTNTIDKVRLFSQPNFCLSELVEASTEADLAQGFRIARTSTHPGPGYKGVLVAITVPGRVSISSWGTA